MRQQNHICLYALDTLNSTDYKQDDLPEAVFVNPSSTDRLSPQIAIPNGLHTCDMTVTVNAFIWQGWLTGEQGQKIHYEFPQREPERQFFEKIINNKKVLIASREEHQIRNISGEKLYTAMLSLDGLSQSVARIRILRALSKGIVLNIGDGDHARLAVGYAGGHRDSRLWTSNPYHPNSLQLERLDNVFSLSSLSIIGVAKKVDSLAYRPDVAF